MANTTKLGIWMDHQNAHFIEYTSAPMTTTTIQSEFTHGIKEETLHKSESLMHHKEQHEQAEYYHKLAGIIKNYDDVILFGPTEAKTELYNILKDDHLFANKKIEVLPADKMTDNQQHAFVRSHFSNQ